VIVKTDFVGTSVVVGDYLTSSLSVVSQVQKHFVDFLCTEWGKETGDCKNDFVGTSEVVGDYLTSSLSVVSQVQKHFVDFLYKEWGKDTGDCKNWFCGYQRGGGRLLDVLLSTSCRLVTVENWSGAQCFFTVKTFYQIDCSLKATQHLFRVHINLEQLDSVPSADAIKTWV
jgi:hypothetical protein